jgi:hypothetical protein
MVFFTLSTCTYDSHMVGALGIGFLVMPPPTPSPTSIIV